MSNAATSALRLTQRIPSVQFSREFFAHLLMEDSAHYLLYSIIFMYTSPMTMVLAPIFLFALLHFASYSLGLLDVSIKHTLLWNIFQNVAYPNVRKIVLKGLQSCHTFG